MFQLVIEAGVGIAVLVRFFVNKRGMESEIIDRLGNGFSRPPFAVIVVSLLFMFYSKIWHMANGDIINYI